jgi:YidC/Oxa1 family membrane protein insertase
MEEKKFDPYQFIGFILIAMILTWMLYRNGPQEVTAEAKAATEQIVTPPEEVIVQDSIQQQQKVLAYGDLGALFMPNTLSNTVLSTEDMNLELQSKGGGISKLQLKEFENYQDQPVPMIQEGNSEFNLTLKTKDGRLLNTKEFLKKKS